MPEDRRGPQQQANSFLCCFTTTTADSKPPRRDVITICQRLDELQSLRLCYDATDIRLPAPLDLRALIRDIVREELHGRCSSCAVEVTIPSADDSLRDLIKQEIASASRPTCSNGPCVRQTPKYTPKWPRSLPHPPFLCLHQQTVCLWLCCPRQRVQRLTAHLSAHLGQSVTTAAIEDISLGFVEGANKTSNAATLLKNIKASIRP
ncbi:hypothetical protein HPB51_029382 [Rhipicephalus microplus]|uniref:Uncharacterized protein n=1 Tax=Rhipicephalus microplus TaxID=6941 RepID=A0A9J6CUU4_RHIMP|nr:hypothetical protein HPB51_029382 [Rhipicephalus microplus]